MLKLEIGKCLKCGTVIIKNNVPTSLWTQRGYRLKNGNINFIGLCRNCTLAPEEYMEASSILCLESPIIDVATNGKKGRLKKDLVDNYVDIIKEAQGGKCFYCGKKLGDNFAISGGHISCEIC